MNIRHQAHAHIKGCWNISAEIGGEWKLVVQTFDLDFGLKRAEEIMRQAVGDSLSFHGPFDEDEPSGWCKHCNVWVGFDDTFYGRPRYQRANRCGECAFDRQVVT